MPSNPDYGAAADRWLSRTQRQLRAADVATEAHTPDEYAHADGLSRSLQVPTAVVVDDVNTYAEQERRQRLDRLHQDDPQLAQFLADPRRMALAKDDTDQLVRINRSLRGPTMQAAPEPGLIEELISQAHGAFIRGKNYVSTFLFDPVLPDTVDDEVARGLGYISAQDYAATQSAFRYAQENRRAAGIERTSQATARQQRETADARGFGEAASAIARNPRAVGVTIAQSLGQGAPALAATAAGSMFGPYATAAAAGGGSFAVEFGNSVATAMQREGVDDTDPSSVKAFLTDPRKMSAAREYATRRGVPIAIFDAITAGVAGRLVAGARPTAASVIARSAGETAIQAGGGAAGELSAQLASGDGISPSDILMEAVAEIPTAAVEVPGNLHELRARRATQEARTLIDSGEQAARLQDFTDAAATSKLGARNAVELEALVADAGDNTVYLSADAARVLFQSANVDPNEFAAQLTGREDAWREALTTDGDLAIPASKWASLVARLPNAPEFARNARLSPEALSAAELADYDIAGLADQTAAQMEPDEATQASAASAQRIEDDVLAQLQAADAYRPADAERQAKLYGAMFRTLSGRLGVDAWGLYEPYALTVGRGSSGPARGARRLMQRVSEAFGRAPRELRQAPGGTERGRMLIRGDRTMRIELLKDADLSTFLHESAHFFWEVFADAAQREDAPQGLRDDYQAALDWFGVTSPDQVTDDHLEQWARGFERYLADGNAPSPELQSLFARFRAWLLDVYRDLTRLNVELSPEIIAVFDRLLATQDEIAAAQEHDGLSPLSLGAEPGSLGLTDRQWQDYTDRVRNTRDQALADAATRIRGLQQREEDAVRGEQRQSIRDEIEQEISGSAGMRAARILSGTANPEDVPAPLRGTKLDRNALGAAYGKDWVAEHLQPLGVLQTSGGVSPEEAAALLGFPSADAMVQALVTDNARNLDAEAESRLDERHPRMDAGTRSAAAVQAAYGDRRFEVLDQELGLLAQLAQRRKPSRRVLRATAAEIIARKPIHSIRPNEYLLAERRSGRKAQRAAARGNYAEALAAKRQQLLNAALFSEANQVRDTVDRHVGFIHRLESPTGRKRLGRAGVLDAFEQVLELFSFRPMSDKQRGRTATLRAWYDRMLAQGIDPQVPESVMRQIDENRRTHYRDMTPSQFEELVDVVRLLDHQAEEALRLRLAGEQYDLDATADTLSKGVRGALKDRGAPPVSEVLKRTFPERTKKLWRAAGSILLRLRTLANWVDGEGNVDGPFHRFVVDPLASAQGQYLDQMRDYGEKVVKLFDTYLKGRDLTRPIWIASLNQNLTESDVLSVALNIGNASNLQRLQDGRGWGDVQVMEILGHMEKADWDFVQSVWDTLESLWPQLADQQRRLTGVEPPKIEPRPVRTPFGEYRGGYYPLVYDRDSTEWKAFVNADSDSFFDPLALSALPPNGHTKERVHQARLPVKLDLGVIPSHLSSILKDLTHRETVIGIRKLMKHQDVAAAMNDTMGPEYLDMVEDKLRQVATDQLTQSGRSLTPLAKFSRGVRRHVGIMAQGLNTVSAIKQIVGVSNSMEVMTKRHGKGAAPLLLQAYRRMFKPGAVDAVMELSPTMRHRISTADTDIRLNMDRYLSGKMAGDLKGKLSHVHDAAVAYAYILIQYVQTYLVDMPLWLAAHEGAQRKGLTGEAAARAADDAVITAQGSGSVNESALIEGNVPFLEWLTMFYSYGSTYLNRQVDIGRDIGKAVEGGKGRIAAELPLLMARAMFLVALPVILDDLINQTSGAEGGPDDDENLAEYYGQRMAAYLAYGIPGLRDVVGSRYGYRLSPAQSIPEAWGRLSRDAQRAMGGEDVEARRVARNAVNVAGYTMGLPLAGPWRHVDYLWRVLEGEEEPESVPEFAAGAVMAKREQK